MNTAFNKIPITLIMRESATKEHKALMRAYGANLILTDGSKGIEYSRNLAERCPYKKSL